jgi:type IV pilus assembly protein PilY1
VAGLTSALTGLKATVASSAAAAVSTPLITPSNNYVFSSTYTTIEWSGELIAITIDPITGTLSNTNIWSSQAQLDSAVSAATDSRSIWMFDSTVAVTKLKSFAWAGMSASEQAYFKNKCVPASNLTQCSSLSAGALSTINSGDQMVGYLRGRTQNLATIFRDRKHVLGDPINSTPAYVADPAYGFADPVTPTYASFKAANAARAATIYFGGNDGMLHAINASTGAERWAYVPKIVMPNLYKLADKNYGTKHTWFVDGSPATMDIFDGSAWRTILVGSFNGGGRGYFALDITDPASPKGMWEICSAATECSISDTDMGLSFSTPIITKRAVDGKWVVLVTSGYNNVNPGTTGYGYFYVLDALTGAVLSKVSTLTGTVTTPSGLGRLSAWADSVYTDNTAKYAYAGDLQGNAWRIDLTVNPPTLLHIGTATNASLVPQPITTKIDMTKISGNRVIFIGTGKLLGDTDMTDPTLSGINEAYQQSLYAVKENGTDHGYLRSSGLIQQSISNVTSTTRTTTANSVNWASDPGYFLDLNPGNSSPGERIVVDPQVALGVLTFASNVPTTTTDCGTAGDSWFYTIDVRTGAPIPGYSSAIKNTGLQIVGYVLVQLPNGSVKIITNYNKKQGVSDAPSNASATKGKRTSWREIIY